MRILQQMFVSFFVLLSGSGGADQAGAASATVGVTSPAGLGVLTVMAPGGQREITQSEIEALGLLEVRTHSPWESGEFLFQGVLLRDFLREVGLEKAAAIVFTGEDGYAQTIPRGDWERWPVVLATRQDGEPLTRRTQGPARVVYPVDDYPELDAADYRPRWVWTIQTIEAAK